VGEKVRQALGVSTVPKPGAAVVESPAPGSTGAETVTPLSTLAAQARKAGKRARGNVASIDADRARVEASQDLEDLWTREQWEEIASWYFDIRFVTTGWEGFRLTPVENAKIGLTFAKTMKVLLKINPEYIAMILFFGNFSSLITKKEAQYYRLRKIDETRRAAAALKERADKERAGANHQ